MRLLRFSDVFWGAFSDDLTTARAPFRAQINQPVGGLDYVEVMLDNHHRVAVIPQSVQYGQQLFDVVEM